MAPAANLRSPRKTFLVDGSPSQRTSATTTLDDGSSNALRAALSLAEQRHAATSQVQPAIEHGTLRRRSANLRPAPERPNSDSRFQPSDGTLQRAKRAQDYLELAGQYRRLLQLLPPDTPITVDQDNVLLRRGRAHGRASDYNPLQCIRNRDTRLQSGETIDITAQIFGDVTTTTRWVDENEVASKAHEKETMPNEWKLMASSDADEAQKLETQFSRDRPESASLRQSRLRRQVKHRDGESMSLTDTRGQLSSAWVVEPSEMFADRYRLAFPRTRRNDSLGSQDKASTSGSDVQHPISVTGTERELKDSEIGQAPKRSTSLSETDDPSADDGPKSSAITAASNGQTNQRLTHPPKRQHSQPIITILPTTEVDDKPQIRPKRRPNQQLRRETARLKSLMVSASSTAQQMIRWPTFQASHNALALQRSADYASNIQKAIDQIDTSCENFLTTTRTTILQQRIEDSLKARLSTQLTPLARTADDQAYELNRFLTLDARAKAKKCLANIENLSRRRRRRFRWARRAGWLAVEWSLVGLMWYAWAVVMILRLLWGTVAGVGKVFGWLLGF